MRIHQPCKMALTGAFLLGLCAAASAQAPAAIPGQQFEIPAGGLPQTVMTATRDFLPGQTAGRHIHHGVEMAIVIRGDLQLMVDGAAPVIYHAGQSFLVPREVPHDVKNVGTTPVTLAITYVIDKGTPARVPVP
jgi:quercetin dioxygenase-like cupin family protein